MRLKAYAKINISLKVLDKRENGYHNLCMINTKIKLHDIIIVKKNHTNKILLKCNVQKLNNKDNLAYKIAQYMFDKYQISSGLYIYIKKQIPIGAGLGGGSSDAATVIHAIDKIFKLQLTLEEKINIGLMFGADIPYCLCNFPAKVEGIGEIITPCRINVPPKIILINPNIEISTKKIFENFIRNDDNNDNDLFFTVINEYKIVNDIYKRINHPVSMTGTGPTLVVYPSDNYNKTYRDICRQFSQHTIIATKIKYK